VKTSSDALTDRQQNLLDLIPKKNCAWERADDGRSYLLVPRFKNRLMRWIALRLGRSEWVKIFFDPIGTLSWELIDGKRSVGDIADRLEAEMGEAVQPAVDRLTEFIVILSRNRFIVFENRE